MPDPITTATAAAAPSTGSFLLPALLLAALAVAAALLSRRRARAPRAVQLLETLSLGPRRSLVLAQLHGESLLLGVSEGGISLLLARPSAAAAAAPPEPAGPALSLVDRLRGAAQPTFAEALADSAEDLELRRKLARRTAR